MPARTPKVTKTCPVCGEGFDVPESRALKAVCCSVPCLNEHKKKQVAKTCAVCGRDFSVPACRADAAAFCSRACSDKRSTVGAGRKPGRERASDVTKPCPVCGELFTRPAWKHVDYCSHKCAAQAKAQAAAVEKTCPECGEVFTLPAWEAQDRTFCSRKCFAKSMEGRPSSRYNRAEKACARCGGAFTVVRARADTAKYCSVQCDMAQRSDRSNPANKQVDLTCPECGTGFTVTQTAVKRGRRFCSLQCRMTAWRKTPPPHARLMTEAEVAWFAALLDGEGTIAIEQRQRRSSVLAYRISVTNTSVPLMDRLVEVTGVSNITTRRKRAKPHHQTCYFWQASGRDAIFLLEQARPWLIVKADRADAALTGQWFPRGSRWDHIYGEDVIAG